MALRLRDRLRGASRRSGKEEPRGPEERSEAEAPDRPETATPDRPEAQAAPAGADRPETDETEASATAGVPATREAGESREARDVPDQPETREAREVPAEPETGAPGEAPEAREARDEPDTAEAAREAAAEPEPEADVAVDEERAPETPAALPVRSWPRTLVRTVAETKRDNVTDLAAGLTYYAMLSIFPMLLAVLSILGLVGSSATDPLIENLRDLTPGPARDTVITAVENLERNQGSASVLFFVSLAGAVWSASRYVDAFMRASNVVYDVEEGRPIWKKLPVRLGITVIQIVALVVSTMAVVLTGDLARQAGDLVGLESSAVDVWNVAKWPVAVLVVLFMLALLYWAAPNVKHPGFRWVSPGSVLAVIIWVVGSLGFALYIENFGSYNETYGTLGGVIIFLAWLWLVNIGILLGAELNAEIERGRQIEAGLPADQQPFLEPRDTRKFGSGP